MAKGFYSVVQYCPDRFRAEAVNVGLVLLCLDPHAVRVRMTGNHERVRKTLFDRPPATEEPEAVDPRLDEPNSEERG